MSRPQRGMKSSIMLCMRILLNKYRTLLSFFHQCDIMLLAEMSYTTKGQFCRNGRIYIHSFVYLTESFGIDPFLGNSRAAGFPMPGSLIPDVQKSSPFSISNNPETFLALKFSRKSISLELSRLYHGVICLAFVLMVCGILKFKIRIK